MIIGQTVFTVHGWVCGAGRWTVEGYTMIGTV